MGDWKRPVDLDPNAFDLETVHFLDVNIIELREHVIANSHNLIYSEIQAICDLTLARGLGTLRAALYLSSKGLLHEVLTLCRSSLEMLMWAFTTFDLSDDQDPFEFLPEKAVSGMKPYFPYTGKYYGYLSKFLHWRKETHTRVFRFEEEYTAVVYESDRNKWEAIANVILMTHLYAEAYIAKYSSLKCKAGRKNFIPQVHALSSKIRKRQDEWLKFFTELDGQELSELFIEVLVSVGKALNSE